jgi:YVTN family beta-propeller protein
MGVYLKLLAALGGSGLAVAFLFGTVLLDRGAGGLSYSRGDPLCNGGSNISEAAFYGEMTRVNARMHAGMKIAPSGDTDRAFTRMMIAHHQGAIDMALVQLKYGGDERLKRLAQSIIVEQGRHGIWPSGDGTRVYVGIENGDAVTAIDTATNQVIATIPNGQAAQALVYVPQAVPKETAGVENLQPLGIAGAAVHLKLAAAGSSTSTTVSLFDQGLTQVLQAAVAGLEPVKPYVLALTSNSDGTGRVEPINSLQMVPGHRSSMPSDPFDRLLIRAKPATTADTWQSLLSRTESWANLYSFNNPRICRQAGVPCSRERLRPLMLDMGSVR